MVAKFRAFQSSCWTGDATAANANERKNEVQRSDMLATGNDSESGCFPHLYEYPPPGIIHEFSSQIDSAKVDAMP
ncbi:hypothetical protein E6O75_ATG11298 [Venturia nashicola]|uniref:Uncharacterized protein n=1 Tax=Venturia nashicola TaxID=86259 RepID=A0A4Z1ND44_9PEZI|nr:hypothetical protein E6O75_ATG11298 [Venturia nashicola]